MKVTGIWDMLMARENLRTNKARLMRVNGQITCVTEKEFLSMRIRASMKDSGIRMLRRVLA